MSNRMLMLPYIFAGWTFTYLLVSTAAVYWASDRALELTDEAYYLLSAMHPGAVSSYVTAQHWVSAPIWKITGSLQSFRLTGALLLATSAAFLAWASTQALCRSGGPSLRPNNRVETLLMATPAISAGIVGSLLYAATIAPSPCYNLFAAAGGYAGLGFALSISDPSRTRAFIFGLAAGAALSIAFIGKASAGIACSFVALCVIFASQRGALRWSAISGLVLGLPGCLIALAALQPSEPPVLESFSNGMELFLAVQSESVIDRLFRYAVTMKDALQEVFIGFWPALMLVLAVRIYPRIWLLCIMLLAASLVIWKGAYYLGGSLSYHHQIQAVYALVIALLIVEAKWPVALNRSLVTRTALLVLPFATAAGTGNALFTQVIVSLAPWTTLVALGILNSASASEHVFVLARQSIAFLLLTVIVSQLITSFTREPYHLASPLIAQDLPIYVESLGNVRVDSPTKELIDSVNEARHRCGIDPGAHFLGLYNVPGLAILFQAVPPVSPWLNNRRQLDIIKPFWKSKSDQQVIIALAGEALADLDFVDGAIPCGRVQIPYNGNYVEIWVTKKL